MLVALTILVTFLLSPAQATSQSADAVSEQSVKAAYLYKFADYVEWPQGVLGDPGTPLTIGVIGADSLSVELKEMTRGRTAHGRSISIRSVRPDEPLAGIHVLFVGAGASGELDRIADEARPHSTLVVTEVGDALSLGSIINFRLMNENIRFDVSLHWADRSGLQLSSRLLAVAAHVEPRAR